MPRRTFITRPRTHTHTHPPSSRGGDQSGAGGGARGEAHIARRSENGLTKVIIGVASQCNGVMFRITDACVLAHRHRRAALAPLRRPRHAGPAPAPCASRPPCIHFLAAPIHPHGSGGPRRGWRMTCRRRRAECAHAHARMGSRTARGSMRRMTPRTRWEAQHAALIDAITMAGGCGCVGGNGREGSRVHTAYGMC